MIKKGRKMSFEIERKFRVVSDAWRSSAIGHTKIRQAYLDSTAKSINPRSHQG
jgi:CYTH domain-containing protein